MNFDFAALLVFLTLVSGFIWAIDALFLAPGRRQAIKEEDTEEGEHIPVLVEYARSFFPVFLIVLILRSFIIEPFRIPSASMMPTLLIGDFILVNKYNYGLRLPVINTEVIDLGDPVRGDIAVFRYPRDPGTPYIKRIIGMPGDHIGYRDKVLYINGERLEQSLIEPYHGNGSNSEMNGLIRGIESLDGLRHQILIDQERGGSEVDTIVPEGHYFVMGDNRDHSSDSRFWGFVPDENLIGRAFMIWMNWNGGINLERLGLIGKNDIEKTL